FVQDFFTANLVLVHHERVKPVEFRRVFQHWHLSTDSKRSRRESRYLIGVMRVKHFAAFETSAELHIASLDSYNSLTYQSTNHGFVAGLSVYQHTQIGRDIGGGIDHSNKSRLIEAERE